MQNDELIRLWSQTEAKGEPAASYACFDDARADLEQRRGAFVLEAPGLDSGEALALARSLLRRAELALGVWPERLAGPPARRLAPAAQTAEQGADRAPRRQVIIDGLSCGARLAGAATFAAADPELGTALRERSDCLYYVGHSSGTHTNAAGCMLSTCHVVDHASVERGLTCAHGAPCPFEDSLFDPRELGAERIIALTCWGIRLDDLYDRKLSVGRLLLERSTLRSLITSVRVIRVSKSELELAYFLVNEGRSSAEIANELNRFRVREGKFAEYLCFGDPELRSSDRLLSGRVETRGGQRFELEFAGVGDYRFELPISATPGRVVLVEGPTPSAMVLHGAVLYVSCTSEPPRVLEIEIVQWSELVFGGGTYGALARDLDALPFFNHAPGVGAATCERIERSASDLSATLSAWPYHGLLPSAAISAGLAVLQQRRLDEQLGVYARSVIAGYVELARRGGLGGAVASGSVWARLGSVVEHSRDVCPHCDAEVVRFHHHSLKGPLRAVEYCDRCGLVHDGDRAVAVALRSPERADLGSALELELDVRNPFATQLYAHALALVQAPRVVDSPASPRVRAKLPPGRGAGEPGAATTLRFEVELPFEQPGIYVLGAVVVVGARFVFVRNHIQLCPPKCPDDRSNNK